MLPFTVSWLTTFNWFLWALISVAIAHTAISVVDIFRLQRVTRQMMDLSHRTILLSEQLQTLDQLRQRRAAAGANDQELALIDQAIEIALTNFRRTEHETRALFEEVKKKTANR